MEQLKLLDVFSIRLKNARIMKGFSMDDLASAMNHSVSKMAISKYEKGLMKPSSSILISLSKALEQPVDYFLRPFSFKIESIQFRKKSNLSAKKEKAIKEQIADLVERYSSIEEICNASIPFSSLDGFIRNTEDAKSAARRIRTSWNLGTDGIVNVIALLEEKGIKVVEIDESSSFDGLSSLVNGTQPVVVLNRNYTSERMRFTAMHELGHLLLPIEESLAERSIESICNSFANEMLLPEEEFKSKLGTRRSQISYSELECLQRQYGISCDAMMYKAKACNIISEQYFKRYCITKNSNPEFKALVEQNLYPAESTLRFRRLVYQALSNNLISISNAASLLNEPIETIRGNI